MNYYELTVETIQRLCVSAGIHSDIVILENGEGLYITQLDLRVPIELAFAALVNERVQRDIFKSLWEIKMRIGMGTTNTGGVWVKTENPLNMALYEDEVAIISYELAVTENVPNYTPNIYLISRN